MRVNMSHDHTRANLEVASYRQHLAASPKDDLRLLLAQQYWRRWHRSDCLDLRHGIIGSQVKQESWRRWPRPVPYRNLLIRRTK